MKSGWEIKPLGELCEFQRGLTYAKSDEVAESNVVVLRANNVDLETNTLDFTDLRYIANTIDVPNEKRIKKGSLLICTASGSKSHLGKVAFIDNEYDYAFGGFMGQITPKPEMEGRYLLHVMTSPAYKDFIAALSDGANINNLKFNDLRNFQVAVPSIAEQRRIVTLLDEAFADIATAKANAEKNLQNAEALFQSQLTTLFNRRAKNAARTTIGQATGGVFTGPFGSLLHKQDYVENGIPLVNPAHISQNGIEPDQRKTVSNETAQRLANYIMRTGDIVIGRRGEMGRCALITEAEDGWLCGTGSFFIKPSPRCDAGYLVHLLRSDQCKKQLEKIAGGAVMPNLSNTDLSNFALELPPVEDQKQIVKQIELAKQEVENLKSIYRQKLTALDDLKKSLLHQAFSGQLS